MTAIGVWWELLRLCARREPRLMAIVIGIQLVETIAFVSLGLMLKLVVDAAAAGDERRVVITGIAAAVAFSGEWVLGGIGFAMQIQLVEKVGHTEVEGRLLWAAAGLDQITHLEQPEYLDRINAVRGKGWAIVDSAWAVVEAGWLLLRLGLVLLLLGSVDPWLLLLLPCSAVQLMIERLGSKRVSAAFVDTGEDDRLQRHLFEVCTSATAGKEVRVAGAGEQLIRLQQDASGRVYRRRIRAFGLHAGLATLGWALFAVGFGGCLWLVASGVRSGTGSVGDLVLALTVGAQLRMVVEFAIDRTSDAARGTRLFAPYLWLLGHAADQGLAPRPGRGDRAGAGQPAPTTLTEGIRLDDVTFTYPGSERPAVDGVTAWLPAGSVVAIVGEYGSGKSTLVKLLAKLYTPDSGRILLDGVDLADLDTSAWREQLSAAFQDFGRYQTVFAHAVGLGDPVRMDDAPTVSSAVATADAEELLERLPAGIDTQLGALFGGVELSEGQWQRVALARACMRAEPLLFVLDEPTASLDAPSEHAIFERYGARAQAIARSIGAVTVIVSHRFSTVADADLILVMDGGRLIELGSHEELLRLDGRYASLFGIQAGAYAVDRDAGPVV